MGFMLRFMGLGVVQGLMGGLIAQVMPASAYDAFYAHPPTHPRMVEDVYAADRHADVLMRILAHILIHALVHDGQSGVHAIHADVLIHAHVHAHIHAMAHVLDRHYALATSCAQMTPPAPGRGAYIHSTKETILSFPVGRRCCGDVACGEQRDHAPFRYHAHAATPRPRGPTAMGLRPRPASRPPPRAAVAVGPARRAGRPAPPASRPICAPHGSALLAVRVHAISR